MELESAAATETELLLLDRRQVAELVDLKALFAGLEQGFADISAGRASVPPRAGAETPYAGVLEAMPAYVTGALAAKLIAVFPENVGTVIPRHQGVVVLFDEHNGTPLALLDAEQVTAIRTALTTAVATKLLARAASEILTVVGTGVQGQSHLEILPQFHNYREIRIAGRTREAVERLAARHGAIAMDSTEEAIRDADVVALCTFSKEPVTRSEWLKPGAHVSSLGFWHELDAETVKANPVFVESHNVLYTPPDGAHEVQGMDPELLTDLGDVVSGKRPGRTSDAQITVFKSTGNAAEDAIMARLIYEEAKARGVGTKWTL